MSDFLDDLAAIEASSASSMSTLPAVAPVHMPEPVPGSTTNVTLGFDGHPLPVSAPEPADGTLQPYPTYEQPAPVAPDLAVHIPDKTPRRVYAHEGMLDENKLMLGLIDANPGLSMDAIYAAANTQLGRSTPQAPVAPTTPNSEPAPTTVAAEPQGELLTVEATKARLAQIKGELKNLSSVIDEEEFNALQNERADLLEELPFIVQAEEDAKHLNAIQKLQEAEDIDATIRESRAEAARDYPQLSADIWDKIYDPSVPLSAITDPFAQAYAAQARRDQATSAPAMDLPNYEQITAALVAQQLGIRPVARASQTAAPMQRTAQPTMQHPGHVPVAAMQAISGQQHTSADRVTTQPANPLANLQAEYQQATAAGDYEAIERLSGIMASGGVQPQAAYPGGILGISYS